jgi:hypothetical protein
MFDDYFDIVGHYYDAYFVESGWCEAVGDVCYVCGYGVSGHGFNSVSIADKKNPSILQNFTSTHVTGCEFVARIGNYCIVANWYTNSIASVDVTDPTSMSEVSYVQRANELKNPVGCVIVNNIWGRSRVIFVCAYGYASVTAIDASDLASLTYITTLRDTSNLNLPLTIAYKNGYLFVACKSAYLSVLEVKTTDTITYTGVKLTDINIGILGGMPETPDSDILYLPSKDKNSVVFADVSDPLTPYVSGYVKDNILLDGALVCDYTATHLICTAQQANNLVAISKNPVNPVILGYKNHNTYYNQIDDVMCYRGYIYTSSYGRYLSISKIKGGKTKVTGKPEGSYSTARSTSKSRICS